ncbi:MAG TPA: hypothetical protein VI588_04160 [Candidatus Gracilibacteria bacterium]|nr:hypothetical protein [Candidatus Gracilibacteria bacterium]
MHKKDQKHIIGIIIGILIVGAVIFINLRPAEETQTQTQGSAVAGNETEFPENADVVDTAPIGTRPPEPSDTSEGY